MAALPAGPAGPAGPAVGPAGSEVPHAPARASVVVAGFTVLSRATGLARVLVVAAVLGPTPVGNAYQVTNTLPNLVWFGFLAGSLVPSVLVPVLVRHLDSGDPAGAARVSRSFLGLATLAAVVVAPLAVLALPVLLQLATAGAPAAVAEEQVRLARLLVVLTVPQVLLYALVGTANAVLYSRRRFALAAAGPTLENFGVIVVLGLVALRYGDGGAAVASPSTGAVLLLGAGSTAAVALNAGLQWWGARRQGVSLRPTGGWRDPEVARVVRGAGRSIGCAGLLAAQTLVVLLLSGRVTGGTVALQVGLSFYALPIALVTTPIGLALLPELARAWQDGDRTAYRATYLRGLAAALFLALPAGLGYLLLAGPLAQGVAAGAMGEGVGERMIAGTLAALGVGLVGQACFFVTMQAAYAAGDTRAPLVCMAAQAVTCAALGVAAVILVDGASVVPAVAACYAAATLLGGAALLVRVAGRWPETAPALLRSCARTVVAAGATVLVVLLVLGVSGPADAADAGRAGALVQVLAAGVAGLVTHLGVARLLGAPELAWWVAGLRRRRGATPTEVAP